MRVRRYGLGQQIAGRSACSIGVQAGGIEIVGLALTCIAFQDAFK